MFPRQQNRTGREMKEANSSSVSIYGANLSGWSNRCFSWVLCAIAVILPKSLPKLLLRFTILFTLAGVFPSVYAGNYIPGSCQLDTNSPQETCEKYMGLGSNAYLTASNATTVLFDCSAPGCDYPYSGSVGSCWSYNQRGKVGSCGLVACPAHASGTPCVCDANYKLDATGTSCVPNALTITLARRLDHRTFYYVAFHCHRQRSEWPRSVGQTSHHHIDCERWQWWAYPH